MANPDHLKVLQQGVDGWNAWKKNNPSVRPDLSGANLRDADLRRADFIGADLNGADLNRANLGEADLARATLIETDLNDANLYSATLSRAILSSATLIRADLRETQLHVVDFSGADLTEADLSRADLIRANLSYADLTGASLAAANLNGATLRGAILRGATLGQANLRIADFRGADLRAAFLGDTNLSKANVGGANLAGADLVRSTLVETDLTDADLTGCRIYGVSAWNVTLSEGTKQQNLIITASHEPDVTVDNIEVAQFVYLLLHNEKIREVIDTVGKKGVLLLGRFTEGRIAVLERLRDELRRRGYLPIVFNFDKPETKDFTETVRLLAGLSKFVIADITNPKSTPLELQATVPEIMVPFRPIIEEGEQPFAMLQDLWIKHRDWVFEPIHYSSVDALIASLDEKIIRPAEARFIELLKRKADTMGGEHV